MVADSFYRRIIKGEITLDDVPAMWREQVKEMLERNDVKED